MSKTPTPSVSAPSSVKVTEPKRPVPLPANTKNFNALSTLFDKVSNTIESEKDELLFTLLGTVIATIKEQKLRSDNDRKEIVELKTKLARAENSVKMQAVSSAAERLKASVLINGLTPHADADKSKNDRETFEQTKERVSELFDKLDLNVAQVPIEDCFRFTRKDEKDADGKKKKPREGPETVKVTFTNTRSKAAFYKALATKKNKTVRVQDCIPKQLLKRKNEMEAFAYKLRINDEATRTRVVYKNGALELKVKKGKEKEFHVVNVPKSTPKRKQPDDAQDSTKTTPKNSTSTGKESQAKKIKRTELGKSRNAKAKKNMEDELERMTTSDDDSQETLRGNSFEIQDDDFYEHYDTIPLTEEDKAYFRSLSGGENSDYECEDRE